MFRESYVPEFSLFVAAPHHRHIHPHRHLILPLAPHTLPAGNLSVLFSIMEAIVTFIFGKCVKKC